MKAKWLSTSFWKAEYIGFYTPAAYKSFHRNALLLGSRRNLHPKIYQLKTTILLCPEILCQRFRQGTDGMACAC